MLNDFRKGTGTSLRSEWGSIVHCVDGSVLVAIGSDRSAADIYHFDTAAQLHQAIQRKELLVRKWVLGVSGDLCILKHLAFPTPDPVEATKMLEFEIPSLLPIPADQLSVACCPLQTRDHLTDYLLYILRVDKLAPLLTPMADAGLEVHRVVPHPLALADWAMPQAAGAERGHTIVLSVNDTRIDITVCVDGHLHAIRRLPPLEDPALVTDVIHDVSSRHHPADGSSHAEPHIIVVGSQSRSEPIMRHLRHGQQEEPDSRVTWLEPLSSKPWKGTASSEKRSDDGDGTCIVHGLLTLVNTSSFVHFNLLPLPHQARLAKRQRLRKRVSTIGLGGLCLFLIWFWLVALNLRIERACENMERRMAPITGVAKSVEVKRRHIAAIENQLADRGRITRIIQELYRFTPKAISLSDLSYTSQGGGSAIKMRGQADILSNAFGYTEALRRASLLNSIQIEDAQQVPRPGGSVVEFRASGVIKGGRR